MMNLMHWRLVLAVVDAGNITLAAAQVGMTQSGASQAIAQLEDTLGAPLFTREHRQTVPTALGLRVADEARVMLEALRRIQSLSGEARGEAGGTLRLASFPMVFSTVLPPVLRRFRQLHPAIDVVSLEASDDEVETLLAAGTVDVGVVLNPAPNRRACPLGQDEWMAVLPAAHPLARSGSAIALADLVAQPFVLATGGCSVHAQSLAASAGLAIADLRATVRDWTSAFALVREGLGVTLVPALTLPENRRGLRVMRLASPLYRSFGLAASAGAAGRGPVQALFGMLQQDDQAG
ncbi:LysR family transcriptional regulator [Achromobacter pestifer]|uniref:HTH-type transcriptional regulator CynR n=1 Tax=Achromobacter pestifer TaxID=1353889 RepID=A0A6S6YNF7_9BURK|nr:LysR family transcriptional regulator [Achromobacter pestifer]CAB3625489.1 HTH-type transcriptional regulator CynR [Achromobacter pestifer]